MPARKRYLTAAAFGLFFGIGFLCGFFSGYKYSAEELALKLPAYFSEDGGARASFGEASPEPAGDMFIPAEAGDIGLVLEEYWMGSDDNGLYIAGAIRNSDDDAFDSVRVAFDLLDGQGGAYSAVTTRNDDRIESGDVWDFTIYIPYSEMDKFNSYRLQSVMGVRR